MMLHRLHEAHPDGRRGGRVGLVAGAFRKTGPIGLADVLVVLGVVGLIQGAVGFASEWSHPLREVVQIDLSLASLPGYTLLSLARGLVAYVFSLAFTLVYGYWAAKDLRAATVLLPLLDILQSIPVLGFMPGLVLALVRLFPHSNVGLELAAVLMIFTGQAWNMTFSYYQSLRAIPNEQQECASLYGFSNLQRLAWVELPASAVGLIWNSMMSMAGGWFFLMINEAFVLGEKDFRLPGLGSYMSVAVAQGDSRAILAAIAAMIAMIVGLDQLVWRPLVAWSQKFRVEEIASGEVAGSWLLDLLRSSRLLRREPHRTRKSRSLREQAVARPTVKVRAASDNRVIATVALAVLVVVLLLGLGRLVAILVRVPPGTWLEILLCTLTTLARVFASTVIATLWTVPAGLAIGLSPRLSRLLQPVIQVAASFPAPMLFPLIIAVLKATGVTLGWGSIVLMLMGTQWYVLFNVTAGAMAVPSDLKEVASCYRLSLFGRLRRLYLPAVFPYLVTGWVTATGGAWNASIVTEYVHYQGEVLATSGVGAIISRAAEKGDFPQLAAAVTVMSVVVVLFNRSVWHRCYRLAEERFSLNK